MRIDYQKDVPLPGSYDRLMSRNVLVRHRDDVMGDLAAQLNVLLDGVAERDLFQIWRQPPVGRMRKSRLYADQLRNAAGGYIAHRLYFNMLQESGQPTCPSGNTAAKLKRDFGSLENFSYAFRKAAKEAPPSGFLWLCTEKHRHGGAFHLVYTPQHKLPQERLAPVLALDLWEHAYLGAFGRDVGKYAACYLAAVDWGRI